MLCGRNFIKDSRFFSVETSADASGFNLITKAVGSKGTMLIPIDIDEDGKMDLLVQSGDQKYSINFVYNNMNYDSFFIKAQMMSPNSEEDPKFGTIPPGATFRYVMTLLEDDEQYTRVATQLPQ